jgi:catechol 2,3-dioxygenase-like lactoylglutathione lyase family enzyme
MRRLWTIVGVTNVARSFRWYQSLLGLPETTPAHDDFGQVVDDDGTVLLSLHEWGAHEHPPLMSPEIAKPGNGLLLFFPRRRLRPGLAKGTRARRPARRGAARESEHRNHGILASGSGRVLRVDQRALSVID